MKSNSNSQDKITRERIKFLKLYVIPITAVVVFVVVLLFLTIPKVTEIFTGLDTISASSQKIIENDSRISRLNNLALEYNSLVQKLQVIDDIAPLGTTEVVRFRDRVTSLILSNNIEIESQRLTEASSESNVNESELDSPIILQEVPFIFTITGPYNNIVEFIKALNSVEDFIVIKEMEFSGTGTSITSSGEWNMRINIVKYQFNTSDNANLRELFVNIPIETQLNLLIQEYIDARLE